MFRVVAPVVIHPTAEARQALGVQLRQAGLAAWRQIARRGEGLEFAHLAFRHAGIPLALCSRLRTDGFIVVELGLGDEREVARVVTAGEYRRAVERALRAGGQA